ncbi:Sytalpha (predicted) [Pycnogonum litorale]
MASSDIENRDTPTSNNLPKSYVIGVYSSVAILVLMLSTLMFYVLCSKRYRLNWYEKTQLATLSGGDNQQHDIYKEEVMSSDWRSNKRKKQQFWVPSNVSKSSNPLRKQATCGSLSGDDTGLETPFVPLDANPFGLDAGTLKYVQPGADEGTYTGTRPKLTSMNSKLDITKINASMYERNEQSSSSLPEDMRGSLNFSISYDDNLQLVCVYLKQACDLTAREFSGTADPYAKVRLLPDKRARRQSCVHKNTLNPLFKEEFVFGVQQDVLQSRTLEIIIYDFDEYSRHKTIGCVYLPFDHIDLSEKITLWKGLTACDHHSEQNELGELMFSLGYLPSAERLTVVVMKAQNLDYGDGAKNLIDSFVKVALIQNDKKLKKKKTSVQRGTLNPIFNEALTFDVNKEVLKTVTLELCVMTDSILGQNMCLGKVIVGPQANKDELIHYRHLLSCRSATAMWHTLVDE